MHPVQTEISEILASLGYPDIQGMQLEAAYKIILEALKELRKLKEVH